MLNEITYNQILQLMLPEESIKKVQLDVDTFYKRKHNLGYGVLNAILVRTIQATGSNLFNEAYLRKVAETIKLEKVKTTSAAIELIEVKNDFSRKLKSGISKEPSWMNKYIEDLKNIEV